jgi:hypothetical protein
MRSPYPAKADIPKPTLITVLEPAHADGFVPIEAYLARGLTSGASIVRFWP